MTYLSSAVGLLLVLFTLLDAFEVVLLPRPLRRRWRVNRWFFRGAWMAWSRAALCIRPGVKREDFIAIFGPLSVVLLFTLWAICLIIGFGLIHWARPGFASSDVELSFTDAMAVSGDAFFTLGYGDVVPVGPLARLLVIVEAGTGFGFIALTISYLPVLYQHFSRRELPMMGFLARAGTPANAQSLLQWHAASGNSDLLASRLREWELWVSDLVESHASYPMLAFYRTQHDEHSWLTALAVVLDTCALLVCGSRDGGPPQASATFCAAQRMLWVVAALLEIPPGEQAKRTEADADQLAHLVPSMQAIVPGWAYDADAARCLSRLRRSYEPRLQSIADHLLLAIPDWADLHHPASSHSRDRVAALMTAEAELEAGRDRS